MPQVNKIKIRRGLNANIPAPNTEVGELRYSTDSKELYIDDGSSNVKIGGDPAGFPISTATQTALNAKANASDTVNLTGDQTVAGVKTFSSSPVVPTATTNTQAVNKAQMDTADAAHVAAADPHPQYMNSDRGDARYASQTYAVMAKSQFASFPSSYGTLGRIYGNDGYKNDLQVYGLSTQAGTPTPDAPVPIVSTTGNVTVRSDSKNLARVTATPITKNGISYGTDTTTGLVTFSGTSTVQDIFYFGGGVRNIPIVAGQTYRISQPPGFSGPTWFVEGSILYNNGTTLFPSLNSFTAADNGMAMLYLVVRNGQSPSNISYYPQLEVGATSTAFEKNTNSTQTLPLGTTQLRSLPNGVSDRIYKDGSTWKLEQNVDYRVLNGSEAWSDQSVESGYFRGLLNTSGLLFKSRIGMNDRFTERANTAHGAYEYKFSQDLLNGPIYIQVLDTRLSAHTTAAFKTWLAANPVTSLSDLATPVTTTITDPTLITALENIRTYQGVTNITASTPITGSYATQAVNKAQMDTADALKVNKAGDMMTGVLNIQAAADPSLQLTNTTLAKSLKLVLGSINFGLWNTTDSKTPFKVRISAPDSALEVLDNGLNIGGVNYLQGTGFPEGVITAPVGSIYIDKAVTNGASSWIKKSGTGSTGWQVLEGDTGWRKVVGWTSAGVITGTMPTNLNPVTGVAGGVFMRRVGSTVQFSVVAGVTTSTSVAGAIPDGFSGGQVPYPQVPISATSSGGLLVVRTLHAGLVTWTLSSITSGDQFAGAGSAYGSTASWLTTQGWPTTLPGVSA